MKNRNIFQQFLFERSNYDSKPISDCYYKSDVLSHNELRAVSSAQIAILHRISSGRQLKQKKRNGSRLNSDAFQS